MSVNQGTKARGHFGALLVGESSSVGGTGGKDNSADANASGTGQIVPIKGFILLNTGTISPGSLAAGASYTTTATVNGAKAGDLVIATPPAAFTTAGVTWNVWVTANNTVTIVITNGTSGTVASPGNGRWAFFVIRVV